MVGLRTKLLPVQRQLLLSAGFPSAVLDPVEEAGAAVEAVESAAVAAVDAVLLVDAVDNWFWVESFMPMAKDEASVLARMCWAEASLNIGLSQTFTNSFTWKIN